MIVHICSCGCQYTLAAWRALECIGYMPDGAHRLELRQCSCHSTRALLVNDAGEPVADSEGK